MMLDTVLIVAVVFRSLSMLGWTYAYFVFPKAIDIIMHRAHLGAFRRHLTGVKNFVEFCGHSHWIMAVADCAMLAMMYYDHAAARPLGVAINVGACVPIYLGARFSIRVVHELRDDASDINRFILAAVRSYTHGTVADNHRGD